MPDTKRGIDAFGGNMPFLGGRRIATQHGDRYAEWLTELYGGTGDTDYVGHFFHRAGQLMAPAGSIGFIATNAIADGDNRRTVLGQLLGQPEPFHIHAAETGMPWPGNAQVLVRERQIGLTETYNLLADRPANDDGTAELRTLHRALDGAVLSTYGWSDVVLPRGGEREREFEDAVAGRLFDLNQCRVGTVSTTASGSRPDVGPCHP